MKFSYNWIQEYFNPLTDKLPPIKEVADNLNMNAFEIDGIEGDILDIDVKPNRAHDAFCHRGIAREIATLLNKKFVDREVEQINKTENNSNLKIKVDNSKLCLRYLGKKIENINVKSSPDWLKEKLEILEERSINNIVDITNFVMLDMGQPMHAFDADKVEGNIHIRLAKKDEKIELLDGKIAILDESVLLIADEKGPLAVAGIKGGKRAEVTKETKNIILEAANFNSDMVRKTSQKLGIKNNSSKRFENKISPELAEMAIKYATKLIFKNTKETNTKFYKTEDFYPQKMESFIIKVSLSRINKILGISLSENDVEKILNKTDWIWKKIDLEGKFVVTVPNERLDLRIKEDLIEEIGRIYGYENIKGRFVENTTEKPKINKNYLYSQKIRQALAETGFSEIYTYAFSENGEIKIKNPMQSDKPFLRNNLKDGIKKSLEFNMKNAALLGLEEIKIFEIGTVFSINKEEIKVGVGIKTKKKIKIEEYRLEDAYKKFASLNSEKNIFDLPHKKNARFYPISQYPFILRDISVWTPKDAEESKVLKIIENKAGELLVQKKLFDKFEKDDKISYAFNLVFQSPEKTLTDDEINKIMEKITVALNSQNDWQVR